VGLINEKGRFGFSEFIRNFGWAPLVQFHTSLFSARNNYRLLNNDIVNCPAIQGKSLHEWGLMKLQSMVIKP
jgi:hypothetical protein